MSDCKTSYLAKVDSDDCTNRAELTGRDDIGKTLGLEEPVGQIGTPARFSLISPNGNLGHHGKEDESLVGKPAYEEGPER
jgi:hypothetical protein